MAQWLKALTALVVDWSLVPTTHARWLTTTYNSSSKVFSAFWPPLAPACMWYTETHMDTYTEKLINKSLNIAQRLQFCFKNKCSTKEIGLGMQFSTRSLAQHMQGPGVQSPALERCEQMNERTNEQMEEEIL